VQATTYGRPDPPPVDPGTPHADGTTELNRALGQMTRILRSFSSDPSENMTGLQMSILSTLRRDTSVRLTAIAAALPCDLSVASRQAMLLVERGYAVKTRDPVDGRALRLELTDAGIHVIDRSVRTRLRWLNDNLAGFDDAQRACAAAVITALIPALRRLKDKKPTPTPLTDPNHIPQIEDHS
jgi:DNA-binding MarR family transcriptional regulator